jgi:prepilin-type N-terminal cleavage/methylation domain-containing protein
VLDRIRTKQANDEGFTLVEMLIVIVVLGVLAGITVFGIATFRDDAEAAACDASVKTVSTAVDAYRAKNSAIPSLAQLVAADYIKEAPAGVSISAAGVVSGTC